jgi:hypothetical protein
MLPLCLLPLLSPGQNPPQAAPASPATPAPAAAQQTAQQQPAQQPDEQRLDELERQVELLSAELFRLEHEEALLPPEQVRWRALAPAASKIYTVEPGSTSLGGYGEMLYTDGQGGASANQLDFLRAIVYFGADLGSGWIFNSELEVEHAKVQDNNDGSGETAPGEVALEFAYLEYAIDESLAARAGLLLLPMGFINELHEPTTFLSANRPEVERLLLPSTWRENGAGLLGGDDDWAWRAYVVNGFDADGFSAGGVRNGRQNGGRALAEDFALTARVDYQGQPGLLVGLAGYHGNAGQDQPGFEDTPVTLADLHADWRPGDWRFRALFVEGRIDDVEALNLAQGFVGNQSVGEVQRGYYLEAGYDLRHAAGLSSSLVPFVRYEDHDTQVEVPDGFVANPANDRSNVTFGLFWQPIPQLAFKLDYLDADNGDHSAVDLLRFSMGYIF